MASSSRTAPPFFSQSQFFSSGSSSMASPSDYLSEKMKNSTCFNCNLSGHWKKNCPYTTPPPSVSRRKDLDMPVVYCACSEICVVRDLGEGRLCFCCPRWKYNGNCGFIRGCDKVWAPQCPCGAGTASVHIWRKMDKNMGRVYFECRVKKGHGACSFHEWEDNLAGTPATDHIGSRVSEKSCEYSGNKQVIDLTDSDMERRGHSSPLRTKRLRFDILDAEDTLPSSSTIISGHWTPEKKNMETYDNRHLNNESAHLKKAESCAQDLCTASQLTFEVHPFRSPNTLSSVRDTPLEEGVFPNFNTIRFRPGTNTSRIADSSARHSVSIAEASSPGHSQVSGICPRELSLPRMTTPPSPPKLLPHTEQDNWQAVTCLKKKLLSSLQMCDLLNDESARNRARTILDALSELGEDVEPLKRYVESVIQFASKVASML